MRRRKLTKGLSMIKEALAAMMMLSMAACAVDGTVPLISDSDDGAIPTQTDAGLALAPCSEPGPGCPCADAGAQVYCGVIYRISGQHVDCSPGYYTCEADGGWSACVGPSIYHAHDN
jgi:hypothetical protein